MNDDSNSPPVDEPRYWEVLELRQKDPTLSYRQIGEKLHLSWATVADYLRAARRSGEDVPPSQHRQALADHSLITNMTPRQRQTLEAVEQGLIADRPRERAGWVAVRTDEATPGKKAYQVRHCTQSVMTLDSHGLIEPVDRTVVPGERVWRLTAEGERILALVREKERGAGS